MSLYGVVYQKWPSSTLASASSFHDPNPREFYPRLAIDDNVDTFWNDNTIGQYPDVLTITLPSDSPVNLTGLLIISDSYGGFITDYSVNVRTSTQNGVAAIKSGIGIYYSMVTFRSDGSMTNGDWALSEVEEISITVSGARSVPGADFSRINEIYPILYTGDENGGQQSNPSSTSGGSGSAPTSTATSSAPTSTATSSTVTGKATSTPSATDIAVVSGQPGLTAAQIAGISIGSFAVVAAVVACICFWFLMRKKVQKQRHHGEARPYQGQIEVVQPVINKGYPAYT